MNNRFLKLLNIHRDEAGIAGKLFTLQFFLIAGSSFLFVTANAIFLSEFPIRQLPGAFFITGIFLFLFNKIYHKAEHLLSNRTLLRSVLVFSIAVTALLGAYAENNAAPWVPYMLLVWYNVVYLLTGMIFWGLAATVFDVRESRRLFTIIGAGDIPAKILGYLSVSLLAPYIGLTNMIWISVALFIIAFLISGTIYNTGRAAHLRHTHEADHHRRPDPAMKQDPGNGLIHAIALLSFISFAALIVIDFIFLAEVKTRYHTDIELAYFLGLFFAGGRVLAIFIKFLLSSRFINYAGLVRSLLLSPVSLIFFVAFIFATQYYFPEFSYLIYLYGIMALITEILKATIQEPVFLILFQPLKLPLRLKGHVFAKGYMLAASLTIVGGALYLFLWWQNMTNGFVLLYVLLAMLAVWIASVFLVKRKYIQNLNHALQRGYLSGNTLFVEDSETMDLLVKKAHSNQPTEVVFALDLLEKAKYRDLEQLYQSVLDGNDALLTDFVLRRIRENESRNFLPYLLEALQHTSDTQLGAKYLQTIAGIDKGNPVLFDFAQGAIPEWKNAAIVGLLNSGNQRAASLGREKLDELYHSEDSSERASAAKIIGDAAHAALNPMIDSLLKDDAVTVRKAAIEAVGKCSASHLIPHIVAALGNKDYKKQAATALSEMKDETITYFEINSDPSRMEFFIRIAGNIPTGRATRYLVHLLSKDKKYCSQIIAALRKRHYVAQPSEKESFSELINKRIAEAREISRMKVPLLGKEHSDICRAAMEQEIQLRIGDALKLLPMVYPQERVKEAVRVLLRKHHQSSNALEMLEISIPRDTFQHLIKLIEYDGHLNTTANKKKLPDVLHKVIRSEGIRFNDWTRAVALRLVASIRISGLKEFLKENQNNFSPILKEASAPLLQE